MLIVKIKYLAIGEMSENLKIRINDMDIKIPITAITPAFNPNKSIIIVNAPSGVWGISKPDTETFDGSANFEIFPDALIANKINKNCMHNKQRKLNDNYNIVKSLAKDGFLRDNSIDLDLNISDSEKLKNFIKSLKGTNSSVNKEKGPLKCTDKGADYVDIDKIGLDKCYNCDADKLKKVEKYINKDFDN